MFVLLYAVWLRKICKSDLLRYAFNFLFKLCSVTIIGYTKDEFVDTFGAQKTFVCKTFLWLQNV